jgi:PAS domain S-box
VTERLSRPRVLVVDDEPILRRFVAQVLTAAGYEVLTAVDGREAQAIAEHAHAELDLVLTDIRMPNLDGLELGRALAALRPQLPVIYMSGFGAPAAADMRRCGSSPSRFIPMSCWPKCIGSCPVPATARLADADSMSLWPQDARRTALRYALAVLTTAVAVVVTRAIQPLVWPSVTPFFILAVAVAALYGGSVPGVLASLLSVVALGYWFFPPFGSFAIQSRADFAREATFLVVAAVMVWIASSVETQRLRAAERGRENERFRRVAEDAAALAEVATRQAREASGQAEAGASKAREAAMEAEVAARGAADALARQQESETALRRNEAELGDLFETASIGMHWVARDGTILRVNPAELEMLGYERHEYVGHNIAEFHLDPQVIDELLRRLVGGETIRQAPARLRCKNGEVKEVVIDSSGYFQDGRFVHTRSFTRDVTAEKQSQDAAARLAAIVSSSSDGIIGKTLDGIVTSWNAAAERIFGYTAAEMVGQSIFKLIPPELHDSERELLDRLRRGEAVEFSESERIRKDGRRVWISLSVSPIRDSHGEVSGAASIKRDITERKAIEEHLRETQRLQAVGQLAGGIAHEANNQMMVVLGGAHFLLRRPDLPEAARQDVELMRRAAERTASITQQLLAFGRRQVLQLQHVNLNAVVESIGPVLRRSLAEHQSLVVRLGQVGATVRADSRQLEQVLLNLALNARDAMPEGGDLTIETCEVALGPADAGRARLAPGTYELLVVKDTGHGMDQATLDRGVRAVLHHQGCREGHRVGTLGGPWDRQSDRGPHPGGYRSGGRRDLQAVLSGRAAGPGCGWVEGQRTGAASGGERGARGGGRRAGAGHGHSGPDRGRIPRSRSRERPGRAGAGATPQGTAGPRGHRCRHAGHGRIRARPLS